MYATKYKKVLACAGIAAMLTASVLQGCGGGSKPAAGEDSGSTTAAASKDSESSAKADASDKASDVKMKEFSTADGSVTISLEEDWSSEDLGVDFWLGVQSRDGNEAVLVMQFPKGGTIMPITGMEDAKMLVNESYGIQDSAEAEVPSIPGMTNVEASTCTLESDGETMEAYLIYGETDYAFYALMYVAEKVGDDEISSMKASCATFVESPIEMEDNTTVEITDTVRWFNASYAVLTAVNGWDYNRFAGLPANDSTAALEQQSLEEWWDVTDRASADETLEWILTEGHRTGFADDGKYLAEEGLGDVAAEERQAGLLENFDVTEEEAQAYADTFAMYEEFGENAIAGWDYCRAMNLLSFYYLAGYYTETEALDKSLEIAQIMQPLFTSWDDLVASYMRGYEYWAEESSEERQAIYEDLKSRDDNPYAVDYNMTLEKTW